MFVIRERLYAHPVYSLAYFVYNIPRSILLNVYMYLKVSVPCLSV